MGGRGRRGARAAQAGLFAGLAAVSTVLAQDSLLGQGGVSAALRPGTTREVFKKLPWGRFKWNAKAPSVTLHAGGFDRVLDTPRFFDAEGNSSNPRTILTPDGTCFGLSLLTSIWFSTFQARRLEADTAVTRRYRQVPSPLVALGEKTGVGALLPKPSPGQQPADDQRLRSVTVAGGDTAVQAAKAAVLMQDIQGGSIHGGRSEWGLPGIAGPVDLVEEFPPHQVLFGRLIGDLTDPLRATRVVSLPMVVRGGRRAFPHAITICGAVSGEAHAQVLENGRRFVATARAIRFDLYDPNLTPAQSDATEGQYLLYFLEAQRFGWPDSPWTNTYLAQVNRDRLPLDARTEELYPEQRAELDKLKGEFFDAHGGLAPESGFGDWACHDPQAAADRARLFDAYYPDRDGSLRRRLEAAPLQEVMVFDGTEPMTEVREPDEYIRRKFGIRRGHP